MMKIKGTYADEFMKYENFVIFILFFAEKSDNMKNKSATDLRMREEGKLLEIRNRFVRRYGGLAD